MATGIPLEIGLRVDVLDDEGIWNTGVVVDVGDETDDGMVEIKYDGWGDEYNQWIPVSADRLAPLHMYTLVKKCWAKLNKWPWWPAFVVLRAPTTKSAAAGLEEEKKLYVEFFDSFDESKRARCWMQKKAIESFQEGFEERASKDVGKKFPEYVDGTQRAAAGDSPLLFSGPGTLPIEYSSKMAVPLAAQRQNFDPVNWNNAYRKFSDRYRDLYGYTGAKDSVKRSGRSGSSEDDEEVEIQEADEDDGARRRSAKGVTKGAVKGAAKGTAKGAVKGKKKAKTAAKRASKGVDDDHEHGYGDEDESEEKEGEEEPEADEGQEEDEDDEDDGEDEEDEDSARGRRSSRLQQKRQHEYVMPTRRTRARRVKVIEKLLESTIASSASATVPSSFQVVVDRQPLSAPAQHPVQRRDDQLTAPTVKPEVYAHHFDDSQVSRVSLSPEWLSPTQTPPSAKGPTLNEQDDDDDTRTDNGDRDDADSDELLPQQRSSCPGPRRDGAVHRRKERFATPQRRSDRGFTSTTAATEPAAERRSPRRNEDRYAPWYGGSREEVDHQPWTIQRWFVHGLRAILNE